MARLWSSGAESNSVTANVEFTSSSSTTVQSSIFRSGQYSLQYNSSLEASSYQFAASNQSAPFYFRFYFNVNDLPAATAPLFWVSDTSLNAKVGIHLQTDGTLILRNVEDSATIGSSSSALSLNTWYLIELKVDTTTLSSTAIEAKLGGTSFASGTINLAAGIGTIRFGDPSGSTSFNYYFDDLAINDSTGSFQNSYPGEGNIIHLKPSAAGDNTDWTNTFANVDEVTSDDASTLISSNTLDQISDFNLESVPPVTLPLSMASVGCIQVGVRFNGAGASSNASFVLRIKASPSGTVEESSAITPSNTTWVTNTAAAPRNYSLTLYDLPGASTTAWTQSDLEQAQIGVRLSATSTNAAQVSTLWLLVEYLPLYGGFKPKPKIPTVNWNI